MWSAQFRTSTGDSTGQNTKDTHPIPGYELKFLIPPGIGPGPPGWKAGTLTDHTTNKFCYVHKFLHETSYKLNVFFLMETLNRLKSTYFKK